MLSKLRKTIQILKEIYKFGGVSYANISYSCRSELLQGKHILITGGSSGIGFSMAKLFVSCSAQVIITGRNESKLKEAINKIGSNCCHYMLWDISNISEINYKLKSCNDIFKAPIDILVNNAGIAPSKFFGDVDEREWDKIYDINLKGSFFLIQEIVKIWKSQNTNNYKKIINISSQGGFVGATYPYRMAKWDIRGLTEGLGRMLIKDNIIVNGIAPGIVKTSMQDFSLQQGDNLYTNQNPINRVCLPEEIAELSLFLVSDKSNFIIGQTILCDGGYILK